MERKLNLSKDEHGNSLQIPSSGKRRRVYGEKVKQDSISVDDVFQKKVLRISMLTCFSITLLLCVHARAVFHHHTDESEVSNTKNFSDFY